MKLKEAIETKFHGHIMNWLEVNSKRVYFEVEPKNLLNVAGFLFNDLKMRLITESAVDCRHAIEILYHFTDDKDGTVVSMRTFISDKVNPSIDSLSLLIHGATWIEREIHELFGVNFAGHPNQKHLLLSEDWPKNNYPMRHDNDGK